MGVGYLTVQVRTAGGVLPVSGASVKIYDKKGRQLYNKTTDESGNTEELPLITPPISGSIDPYSDERDFSIYLVEVDAPGYQTVKVYGVQIFDGITSILPVIMQPGIKTTEAKEIVIPLKHGVDQDLPLEEVSETPVSEEPGMRSVRVWVPREVAIPEYITVHLGAPSSSAKNVRLPFADYIKNVASSEIYPTWDEEALRANIYAQISFALNRIYTVWYKSRGYNFDITNSTAYDQFFVDGRNIFENISEIVDEIFNQFIRRKGSNGPFFAQYCNGTTVTCDGMSQWGTQSLAEQGYDAMKILKSYYPNDIEIAETNNFISDTGTYPGTLLREGSISKDVQTMQHYLNRIRVNYPLIPQIENPNGIFGPSTTEAVKTFQQIFKLAVDGIIGPITWYKISRIYVGVTKLAELDSEGERIGLRNIPPRQVLTIGSKGEYVVELQFLLNAISMFYPNIPYVVQDSLFDQETRESVLGFQKEFGLTVDGIVGSQTWNKLYDIFKRIADLIVQPKVVTEPKFSGQFIGIGSTGDDVQLMQNFLNAISKVYTNIPSAVVDGTYSFNTANAVMFFQQLFGLTIDGVIGPSTWNKIIEVYRQLYT